jgi:hypothetical protein
MKRKFLLGGILAVIVSIALIAGCAIEKPAGDEEAIVEITINQDMFTAKTIDPGFKLEIAEYEVMWWFTDGTENSERVEPSTDGKATVYLLLKPGQYHFKVIGYKAVDETENPIGESDEIVQTIDPRDKVTIPIPVHPIRSGSERFSITVDWSQAVVANIDPTIYVYVYNDLDEDPTEPPLEEPDFYFTKADTNDTSATGTSDELTPGYYKCFIRMEEGGTSGEDESGSLIWSTVEALRIVEYYPSSKTYTLIRHLESWVTLNIDDNLQNPLILTYRVNGEEYGATLPADPFSIDYLKNITIRVKAINPEDMTFITFTELDREWYLNGYEGTVNLSGSAYHDPSNYYTQLSVGNGLSPGFYSVDVLIKKDGTVSSGTVNFIIENPVTP